MFDDRIPTAIWGVATLPQRSGRQYGSGAAPLIALAIIALIVGGLFWFAPSNDQVATNTPAVERSAPAPQGSGHPGAADNGSNRAAEVTRRAD